jgi:hypothetical protein
LRTVSQPMKPSPQLAPDLYVAVSTTGAAEEGVTEGAGAEEGAAEDRLAAGLEDLAAEAGEAARATFDGDEEGDGVGDSEGVSITAAGTTEGAVVCGTTSLGELSLTGPADRTATQPTMSTRMLAARMISE